MSEVILSSRAYIKIIFHAAKYPHCAVNGILLASRDKSTKTLNIVDAIPLFHQCLHVTPMAEIALLQIETMAAEDDLQIVGYYAGAENFNDNSLDKAPGGRIADKIAENYPSACFAVIDNKSLTLNMDRPALKLWQTTDGHWNKINFQLSQSNATIAAASSLLQRGAMKDLNDFDNFLDNTENDWSNTHLNIDLNKLLAMY